MNSIKIICNLCLIFFLTFNPVYFTQNNSFEVNLNLITVGNSTIDQGEWEDLVIGINEPITFSFSPNTSNELQVFYKIFIDGIIAETKYESNFYTITKNNEGAHIIRIVPYTSDLIEGLPIVFAFTVQDLSKNINTEDPVYKETENEGNNILYFLIAVIVLMISLILYLLFKRKGNSSDVKMQNDTYQELSEIKHSHKRLLDELKHYKEENEHLRKKIEELNLNINTLEKANFHLVEQKEKLAVSKRKLELLHAHKEELFAMAIHDIKNPASAIRGYIELLNSYELNATEQQEIITSLVASSDDIVKLSQDMCEIIAKAMPEPKLKFVEYSIKNIIVDVCNQNASYAKAKKVKLINKGTSDLPSIKIDPEKIEEAIDNLVNNAIKYAPPDTIVEVRSFVKTTDKKYIVVEVEDNGVGLAEEDIKKSFKKGSILSAKPTGLEQSSGLGLWIVKRIIDEHNGKVSVESKQGVGSTFTFILPIIE